MAAAALRKPLRKLKSHEIPVFLIVAYDYTQDSHHVIAQKIKQHISGMHHNYRIKITCTAQGSQTKRPASERAVSPGGPSNRSIPSVVPAVYRINLGDSAPLSTERIRGTHHGNARATYFLRSRW